MTWRPSQAGFLVLECGRDLNALARYFRGGTAVEQFVGRERYQRACHRQLVRNVVVARRVNSTVIAPRTNGKTCSLNHGLNSFGFSASLCADVSCVMRRDYIT